MEDERTALDDDLEMINLKIKNSLKELLRAEDSGFDLTEGIADLATLNTRRIYLRGAYRAIKDPRVFI